MEYLYSAIVGWFVSNVLNRFIFRGRRTDQIIATLEGRLAVKDRNVEQLRREQKRGVVEKERIVRALRRKGLSTEKLVRKYNRPLNAILISYASQKELDSKGRTHESHFIRPELERYNVKYLGGTDSLIPPAMVPAHVKDSASLRKWFGSEILKGRYCKLKFLALVDLRKGAYWSSNLPYEQTRPMHFTIGEVLAIEDIFTDDQILSIALGDIVRSGDIAWLASDILSQEEHEILLRNQELIEADLGNPSLRLLSSDRMVPTLSEVLGKHGISDPREIAGAIVGEAKFWHSRLR